MCVCVYIKLFFSPLFLRTLVKSAPDSIEASLHSFFEAAAADLEVTVENLSVNLACLPQSRNQHARGTAKVLSYTTSVLLPTLTSLFQHLGNLSHGVDLLGEGNSDNHHKENAFYNGRIKAKHVFGFLISIYSHKLLSQTNSCFPHPLNSLRDTLSSILPHTFEAGAH